MSSENLELGFAGFADAFGDIFGDIFAKKDAAAEPKKLESKRKRQPIQVESRVHLTVDRVRDIISDQFEELADHIESLFLGQRDVFERQHTAQLDQLSKTVALVDQMQGASHAEPASLGNLIREIITNVVLDAACELDDQIYLLQGTIREDFNEQTEALAYIMREVSDCKTLLMQSCTKQSSGRRRCKVNMRKRRFGAPVQGGDRG